MHKTKHRIVAALIFFILCTVFSVVLLGYGFYCDDWGGGLPSDPPICRVHSFLQAGEPFTSLMLWAVSIGLPAIISYWFYKK